MLEIRTVCHAQDLWQLGHSCKQLCLGAALLSGFQSSQGALKSTELDSYLVNALLFGINIWKTQKYLVRKAFFLIFDTVIDTE